MPLQPLEVRGAYILAVQRLCVDYELATNSKLLCLDVDNPSEVITVIKISGKRANGPWLDFSKVPQGSCRNLQIRASYYNESTLLGYQKDLRKWPIDGLLSFLTLNANRTGTVSTIDRTNRIERDTRDMEMDERINYIISQIMGLNFFKTRDVE